MESLYPCSLTPDGVAFFSQNEFARPRRILPSCLSFSLDHWLGRPYEFNDLRVPGGNLSDESLLAILYCPPPAVLSFWLGGAELGSIALCRKCIGSPRSKPRPCVRRTADE